MRPLSLFVVAVGVGLSGCGGGDDSGPSPVQFPSVAGTYSISGSFDGVSPEAASFAGSVRLTQRTLTSGALGGTFNVTATIDGESFPLSSSLTSASVARDNALVFTAGGSGVTWRFSGSVEGFTVSGRHTLSDGTFSQSGNWYAARSGALAEADQVPAATELMGVVSRRLAAVRAAMTSRWSE